MSESLVGRQVRRATWPVMLAATLTCACGQTLSAQHTFRPPFDDINPFTGQRQIDQWDLGGTAQAHRSFVRLTAEAQSSRGWMTAQQPLTLPEWSAMLEIRASGHSQHLYGDGLAIWIVKAHDHISGPVFGREDKWNGLGLFFDTFQNIDHSHHHKHPYIYAMVNDGTKEYIPDAEKPDTSNQVLPGAVDNSGCSYEFRYTESREDVTVLNHTRVHFSYKGKTLKLRLQQTSAGENKEWYNCFEMKDVTIPNPAFFGVSSATGDLVDNHDIIQFVVRPLTPSEQDVDKDYESWEKAEKASQDSKLAEFDLRPPEALQRDYQRVIRAQAEAIKTLSADVETLKQSLEFQLSSISNGVVTTKKNLDDKSNDMRDVGESLKATAEIQTAMSDQEKKIANLQTELVKAQSNAGGGWKWPFFMLFVMILGLAGVGYNRYRKLYGKSHLP